MIVGIPKEIKPDENRVAVTPAGVQALVNHGHEVVIEAGAGIGSGISDEEYVRSGAKILPSAPQVFEVSDMILKVKEPLPPEYGLFRKGQVLFTYLHLAPEPTLTQALIKSGVKAVAYETVQLSDGSLPLLTPMSEIAGRMAVQIGATLLEKRNGGCGILLGGVPGVPPAEVCVVGGGTVGINAARIAVGMGARVTVLDVREERLRYIDDIFGGRVNTLMSNPYNVSFCCERADLLIGAVLVPGARAPKLVTENMVRKMKPGSAIVDVAIDQGGSVETIDRTTTHSNPTFTKYGVIHYSVPNIPGAVPRTSTFALTNSTLKYALLIADQGLERAVKVNPALAKGVNVYEGHVTYKAVADAHGLEYTPLDSLI
ncbi:MAG TPA: alanine dehydrogenase [Firmicutes bacterium]|nr:alanine dehydrogenase [Bacillota bacterium]